MKLHQSYSEASGELEHDLRRDIYRGQLLPGEKLCSESQLAKKFGISRSTVRKALDSLAAEGLIRKVRGSGTFVSEKKPEMRLHSFSPRTRNRQILFLSFSTIFSEETLHSDGTFGPIFDGLGRVLNAYRYNLLIGHVNTSWAPPACLLNGDVGGIVFHGRHIRREFREKYMAGLPCVGLQLPDPEMDCSWVCIDNFERSYLAVKHLYDLGHRKIAFLIRDPEPDSFGEERLRGFRRSMRRLGLECPEEYCIVAPPGRIDGERRPERKIPDFSECLKIFRSADRPTALIIQDWAEAVIRPLEKMGLRVPEDVSLVSGANEEFPDDRLTYVCDRFEEVCAEAARLMVDLMEKGERMEPRTVLIRPALHPGRSTARV